MEYVLTTFRIKSGKTEQTREFLQRLHAEHQTAMRKILAESNMTMDCSFIVTQDNVDYLHIFKQLESTDVLGHNIATSPLPLYVEIRTWADECLETDGKQSAAAVAVFER